MEYLNWVISVLCGLDIKSIYDRYGISEPFNSYAMVVVCNLILLRGSQCRFEFTWGWLNAFRKVSVTSPHEDSETLRDESKLA